MRNTIGTCCFFIIKRSYYVLYFVWCCRCEEKWVMAEFVKLSLLCRGKIFSDFFLLLPWNIYWNYFHRFMSFNHFIKFFKKKIGIVDVVEGEQIFPTGNSKFFNKSFFVPIFPAPKFKGFTWLVHLLRSWNEEWD